MTYKEWIHNYLTQEKSALGKCKEAVEKMSAEFPELKKVAGHVYTNWGQRAHWWCETTDGEIIDPTASQFPIIFEYEKWEPGMPVRVGKCMDCGEEIYEPVMSLDEAKGSRYFCSKKCEQATLNYMNGPRYD